MCTYKKQAGFTLVELSIVIVIIGLLVTAVVSGRAIIEASEARAVMAEIREHMQSFTLFSERYRAYPGDFRNASTTFTTAIDALVEARQQGGDSGAAASDYDGDGNNRVEWSDEDGTRAWLHLQLAGLSDGSYSGLGTTAVLRANIPPSNIGGGGNGYYMDYSDPMQNHLGLGGFQEAGGINNRSAISPQRGEAIDRKLDDGKPAAGFVRATEGSPAPAFDCVNDDTNYNLGFTEQETAVSCLLLIRLDE